MEKEDDKQVNKFFSRRKQERGPTFRDMHLTIVSLLKENINLRADNKKLREALICIDGMATNICMKDDAGYGIRAESVMPIYETARAALEGVTEKSGAGNG